MKRIQKIQMFRAAASFLLTAVCMPLLVSCSSRQNNKDFDISNNQTPVMQVKHSPYIFSMHPQYKTETESLLKLGIRDQHNRFVHGAIASAELQAKDGDKTKVGFLEDPLIEKYVAVCALQHHEDYVIRTRIEIPEAQMSLFRPKFSFHCCDPIPEAMIRTLPTEEKTAK
jgi:hypothetical protein